MKLKRSRFGLKLAIKILLLILMALYSGQLM